MNIAGMKLTILYVQGMSGDTCFELVVQLLYRVS